MGSRMRVNVGTVVVPSRPTMYRSLNSRHGKNKFIRRATLTLVHKSRLVDTLQVSLQFSPVTIIVDSLPHSKNLIGSPSSVSKKTPGALKTLYESIVAS